MRPIDRKREEAREALVNFFQRPYGFCVICDLVRDALPAGNCFWDIPEDAKTCSAECCWVLAVGRDTRKMNGPRCTCGKGCLDGSQKAAAERRKSKMLLDTLNLKTLKNDAH